MVILLYGVYRIYQRIKPVNPNSLSGFEHREQEKLDETGSWSGISEAPAFCLTGALKTTKINR